MKNLRDYLSNGPRRYVLLLLLVLSWTFWITAVFSCRFMKFRPDYEHVFESEYGLFSEGSYTDDTNDFYGCQAIHPDELDDMGIFFKAARSCGALGFALHSLALINILCVELFVRQKARARMLWSLGGILITVSFVCSILIFLAFGMDACSGNLPETGCKPAAGSRVAMVNVLLLFLSRILALLMMAPRRPLFYVRFWDEFDDEQHGNGSGAARSSDAVATVAVEATESPASSIHLVVDDDNDHRTSDDSGRQLKNEEEKHAWTHEATKSITSSLKL